jgi:hypothetical protein
MSAPSRYGPWSVGDQIERRVQFRSLAGLVAVLTRSSDDRQQLLATLRQAETDDAAADRALVLFEGLPALTKRRILSTFGAVTWPRTKRGQP